MEIENTLTELGLLAGVVTAQGVKVGPSPAEFIEHINNLISSVKSGEHPPAHLKDSVRELLRAGGFKPSGRSKPASEYLVQAAQEDRFPFINNLVDINNCISLLSGLPVSMLDLAATTESISFRLGQTGERYIFNSAGHEIDLAKLLCVCRGSGEDSTPLGNPVKDSMEGKIQDTTQDVVGIIYAPSKDISQSMLEEYLGAFAQLLEGVGSASAVTITISE